MRVMRIAVVALGVLACSGSLAAQAWREQAQHLGGSTRVLLVGARPEDEDNALLAWLRTRHIDAAFLSLSRGESGRNVAGAERNAPLAVVRTAELLAERARDGAHQYFTRAFDPGVVDSDADIAKAWPAESLLVDMVAIIRAYRPHVIVSMVVADSSERDAVRRHTARLVAQAYAAAGDSSRVPERATARLPVWVPSRLLTRLDSTRAAQPAIPIDVGEFDREEGRSIAELGAEIRRLQRTQGPVASPPLGSTRRWLRVDSTHTGDAPTLLGGLDTALARLAPGVPAEATAAFDSVRASLAALAVRAPTLRDDSLAVHLARVASQAIAVRVAMECREQSGVAMCGGVAGELATVLTGLRERAMAALLPVAGVVLDANAERDLVAAGDSVSVAVTVHNGGDLPVQLTRLAVVAQGRAAMLVRDSSVALAPSATARFVTQLRMLAPTRHWWQVNAMMPGTLLQRVQPEGARPLLPDASFTGAERLSVTSVEATLMLAGVELPVVQRTIASRGPTVARGDQRRPVIGVPPTSVLLDPGAEYERAGMAMNRLARVTVANARSTADTVAVTLLLPVGVRADSASKTLALPPYSARTVFFRLQGTLPAGEHTIEANARSIAATPPGGAPPATYSLGTIVNEYPHIPAQHFVRFAKDRVSSVSLTVPPAFRVAYVRGSEDIRPALQQLRLPVQSLDLALLPVSDLSAVTAIIIGAGALRGEAGLLAGPVLRTFMQRGGVVLVLPGAREVVRNTLFPVPFEMREPGLDDDARGRAVTIVQPESPLFSTPNRIAADDFEPWAGDRSCSISGGLPAAYAVPIVVERRDRSWLEPGVLMANVGRGRIIYSSLCLGQQLEAAQPGAAKLLVNMLSPWRVPPQ